MSPNIKHVNLSVPVPLDPSQYRPTVHFGQRLRERVPDGIQDDVIEDCIREGGCHGVSPRKCEDNIDEHEDVVQFFGFDGRLNGRHWRVVVGLREAAYLDRGREHLAVTVYEVGDG